LRNHLTMQGTDKRTLTFIYQSFVKNTLENLGNYHATDMDAIVVYTNEKMLYYLFGEMEKNTFLITESIKEKDRHQGMEGKAMAMKQRVFYSNELERITEASQIPAYELFTALVQYPDRNIRALMQQNRKYIEFYQTQQCKNS